jgi:hypothetical protein
MSFHFRSFRSRLIRSGAAALSAAFIGLPLGAPAFALDIGGQQAFIIDRCGGDYDCKDVKLVVLNATHDKAMVYGGAEANDHDADRTPSHVSGYRFQYDGGSFFISQDGRPSQVNGKDAKVGFNNGVVYESDRNYVYVYSTCPADGASGIDGIQTSCELNYIGVDKKTLNSIAINGHYAPMCGAASGQACSCKDGGTAGQFSFLNKGFEYRLSSDLCLGGKATLAILSAGKVRSSFDLRERPLAGSN